MSKVNLGLVVAAGSLISAAAFAQSFGESVSTKSMHMDEHMGLVTATGVEIIQDRVRISAARAQYTVDHGQYPRVMDLSGGVEIRTEGNTLSTDIATYYPDLQAIISPQFNLLSGTDPGFAAKNLVALTCSGGVLHANGSPIGTSWCSNQSGGGSVTYSCGGAGGNSVTSFRTPYSCSGG